MNLFQDNNKSFLEGLVDYDIETRYTSRVRISCHFLLWFFLWILSILYYTRSFNLFNSNLFAMRNVLCDIIFFYFFFYYIIRLLLNKNLFFLFLIGGIASVYLWVISNYFSIKFLDYLYSNNNKILYNEVHSYSQTPFSKIITIKSISYQLYIVLSFISIPSFIKILFDITKYYSKSIIQERHNKSLEIDRLNLEKNFLSAQLNPHFLFNTFNNLYALALKQSSILPDVIEQLSNIMRYTVYDASAEKVTIGTELKFIKNYIELEKLRYSSNCTIEFYIADNIPVNDKIAPLLFFPFVENAFKYGLKSKLRFVRIWIEYKDRMILFKIENDNVFIEKKIPNSYGGVGISNVRNRLNLLYQNQFELNILPTTDLFLVELKLQL